MPTLYKVKMSSVWMDMMALGQTDQTRTENLNQVMWPTYAKQTQLWYWQQYWMRNCFSCKRLNKMHPTVHIVCFRVKIAWVVFIEIFLSIAMIWVSGSYCQKVLFRLLTWHWLLVLDLVLVQIPEHIVSLFFIKVFILFNSRPTIHFLICNEKSGVMILIR